MIRHSLKMIWAERKSNSWILIELIIVFTILWFCSTFIYDKGTKYFSPVGFDIKHTYILQFGLKKNISWDDLKNFDTTQDGITTYDRVKKCPEIEYACFSRGNAYPYSGSYSSSSYTKDSVDYNASVRDVNPDFFDVFQIKFQKGGTFDPKEVLSKKQVVITPDKDNKFYNENVLQTNEVFKKDIDPNFPRPQTDEEWRDAKQIEVPYQVAGVTNRIKRGNYENYTRIVFNPLQEDALKEISGWTAICIRVKPSADKDFSVTFLKKMKEQLSVGAFELVGVKAFSDMKKEYMQMTGDEEKVQTVFVIIFFLLINVFLGILGTFRFRANARRGEIGLRCAVGSSKNKIQRLLLGETFFMLVLASIPATIIAINIQLSGIISKLGIPLAMETSKEYLIGEATKESLVRVAKIDMSMFNFNIAAYFITFIMMLIIIWLGTWYPAKKASEIQPAEALHYE